MHYDDSGTRLLVAAGPVQLWDVATVGDGTPVDRGEDDVLVTFEGHEDWVQEAVFSPDEQQVASCSGDGTARLSDSTTGEELQRLIAGGLSGLCRLRFSPDRSLLAISDAGKVCGC